MPPTDAAEAPTVTARMPAVSDSHATSIHVSPEMVASAVIVDVHAAAHEAMRMAVGAPAFGDDLRGSVRWRVRIATGAAAVVAATGTLQLPPPGGPSAGQSPETLLARGAAAVSRVMGAAVTVDVTAVVQASGQGRRRSDDGGVSGDAGHHRGDCRARVVRTPQPWRCLRQWW
ncbi:MAG: hypothetical protein IPK64_21120 [bacterium]|nr:hypothetical protein [bacterium]